VPSPSLVSRSLVLIFAIGAWGSWVGCSEDVPENPSTLKGVKVTAVSPRNIRLTWEPMAEAQVIIHRKGPGSDFREVGRKAGDHGRFLDLALEPETSYRYRLTLCRQDNCEDPYETVPVATQVSQFPSLEVTVPASGTNDDVVIFGVYRIAAELFREGHMAAVDRSGRVIWEYATYEWGPITEVQALPDGTLATGQNQYLVHIDLDGTELYRWTETTARHDIDRLADGRWAFLHFDPFEAEPGVTRLGDVVILLNREGTAIEWEWRGRDHIPWTDVNEEDMKVNELGLGQDWTHSNAITFDDAGTKVLLNVRNLNRIYKIDVATKQVDWIMGDGGDFGEGLWDHSHDPQFLGDNRVLIFDNGYRRPSPQFSRVIEVEFDPSARTAEMVWEYRESPDFYSFALGSVQQQDNGNVFITDGTNGRLLEVTRDKQKVWELLIQKYYWSYKAITVPRSFFTDW
jgi:hypothetical protein